jgi:S1-C subfamily serine protease
VENNGITTKMAVMKESYSATEPQLPDIHGCQAVNCNNQPSTLDVLGMVVTRIDRQSAMKSGMDLVTGLIVMTVRLGSLADKAWVATGDIICEVDGNPVTEICQMEKLLAAHDPREPVRMLFRRVGAWRYLAIPLDDSFLAV